MSEVYSNQRWQIGAGFFGLLAENFVLELPRWGDAVKWDGAVFVTD